jgi:hypothetical protein
LRRAIAAIAARLVATRGWEPLGFARLRDRRGGAARDRLLALHASRARQVAQGPIPGLAPGGPVDPGWAVAEAIAAEVLSALPLDAVASRSLEPADGCASEDPPQLATSPVQARHPLGPEPAHGCAAQGRGTRGISAAAPDPHRSAFLRPLVDGLEDADSFELDARLRRAIALEQPFLRTRKRVRRPRVSQRRSGSFSGPSGFRVGLRRSLKMQEAG